LIKTKRIIVKTMDGRKGCKEEGPYDVIHVGGAMSSVPKELED
jgi:protein-L-isoaspartate O-methyltransferase